MHSKSEEPDRPFLEYSDDPDKEEARNYRQVSPARGNLMAYVVVCFATSLFWAGLFYLLHPGTAHVAPSAVSSPTTIAGGHTSHGGTVHSPTNGGGSNGGGGSHNAAAPDRHNITTGAHLLTCGTSVASARAAGCRYDILLNNWVPAPCYDQEFVDEYVDDDSWGGYADEALTQRLTAGEMAERDHYYTSLRDHVNHCAMMWRKQFWVLYEERRAFDTVIASPGHTDHCAQFLVDVGERNWTHPTKTEMGFAGCWVRDDRLEPRRERRGAAGAQFS